MKTEPEPNVIPHRDLAAELARLKAAGQRVTRMAFTKGGYLIETTIEAEPELWPVTKNPTDL